MAVTKREYIFGTFIVSCISLGFLLGAIGSQNWITADVKLNPGPGTLKVSYGLFQGEVTRYVLITPQYDTLYPACNFKENVCLYTCKTTHEARQAQITNILNGCEINTMCNSGVLCSSPNSTDPSKLNWFNGGVYISTILFLCISIVMAAFCALISVYNTAKIPAEPFVGVFGLYIWNACAAVSSFIVLLMWGVHFETNLGVNLAYTDTMLTSAIQSNVSNVGLSYWSVLISFFCHLLSPAILSVRQYLINREPPPPMINIDKNTDDTIFLY